MSDSARTNWLDVIKSALWPTIALLALIFFSTPVSSLLEKFANQISGSQEITIGSMKIQLNLEAARKIPPPTKDMVRAFSHLKPEDIDVLLSHAENVGRGVCTVEGAHVTSWRGPVDEARTYLRFSEEGMVEFTDSPFDVRDCPKKEQRLAKLTEFGKTVRRYLLDVITSTLTIGASSE